MANEVAKTFEDVLSDKLAIVESALPKDFNRERFVQNCMAVFNDKTELQNINRQQLLVGVLKGAYLGLDFMNKECYLIPYNGTVQFQTDYKGECKFVKRYSIRPIQDIFSYVVREGDEFTVGIENNKPTINFRPVPFNTKDIVGAFAMAIYKDGGMDYETMNLEEINGVRNNYSRASQSKAWKCSFPEMARKTVLRRLCKHIETDFETAEARNAWDEGSGMNFSQPVKNPDELVNAFDGEVVGEDGFREVTEDAET